MDSNIVSHVFILVSLCEMNKQTLLAVMSIDLSSVDRFVSRGARVHEAKHSLSKCRLSMIGAAAVSAIVSLRLLYLQPLAARTGFRRRRPV